MDGLIGAAEIAKISGFSYVHINKNLSRTPGFPATIAQSFTMQRRWNREEVLEWFANRSGGRGPQPRKGEADPILRQLVNVLRGAKRRNYRYGREICLDLKQVRGMYVDQGKKCAVSGITFSMEKLNGAAGYPFGPSLDRIDNARGYTPDNTRLVCCSVNYLMNQWGDGVFDRLAQVIRSTPAMPKRAETADVAC